MTLILTAVCPTFTVQVSDRLVTSRNATFDSLANKVLIYYASDAIVTIGYAGVAFLDGVPTDEWIAERLWGERLFRFETDPVMGFRMKPKSSDLGWSIRNLRAELQHLASKLPRQSSVELTIAGWQWTKRHIRPTVAQIFKEAGTQAIDLHQLPRHWYKANPICVAETGGWLGHVDPNKQALHQQIGEAFKQPLDVIPNAISKALANAIRRVASSCHAVGSNLMSVTLPPPGSAPIQVEFLPFEPHRFVLEGSEKPREMDVVYTPWVITPSAIAPPSVAIGDSTLEIGQVAVQFKGAPPTQGGLLGLFGSQRRPVWPLETGGR